MYTLFSGERRILLVGEEARLRSFIRVFLISILFLGILSGSYIFGFQLGIGKPEPMPETTTEDKNYTITLKEGVREYSANIQDINDIASYLQKYEEMYPRIEPHKAYITETCRYVPPINGTQIDKETLIRYIKDNLNIEHTIDVQQFYVQYKDTDAGTLKRFTDQIHNCYVRYTNGNVVRLPDLGVTYHISDNSITYNKELLRTTIRDIANSYDDVGRQQVSINGVNGAFSVSGGTWGHIANTQAEMDHIEHYFDIMTDMNMPMISGETLSNIDERIPIMKQDLSWEFPSTYIEIDKTNQHVYVVSDNIIIMESDCVTGKKKGHDTPTGIYFISEKMKDKTLTGPGYSSFVHRWMRLTNTGIGLHDATWRGRFGGQIYTTNGSHGCINLPKKFAYELYDYVYSMPKADIVVFVHV